MKSGSKKSSLEKTNRLDETKKTLPNLSNQATLTNKYWENDQAQHLKFNNR